MNKYSICIVDDAIPIANANGDFDDTRIINSNVFKYLLEPLNKNVWEEPQLYELISNLYEDKDNYEITGFTNHTFLFNYIEDNLFSPDIVIFDWNVGESKPSEKNLLKLLKIKYCLVAIYTGADSRGEIKSIIDKEDFDKYRERLFIQIKGDEESVDKLKAEIKNKLNLFSFKLNKILKQNILQSTDNILINIGKLSFNQFVSLFGENNNGQKELSEADFIDIFLEQLKYELTLNGMGDVELKADNENIDDIEKVRELWHYRMYHKTNDQIIRKGDVLKKGKEYFLVLSSDCHLNEFWNKNLGYLMFVKLHKVDESNGDFKKRLNYRPGGNLTGYKLSSLVNPSSIKFLTILPSLVHDKKYFDYALNPKELSSISIDAPDDGNSKQKLLVEHLDECEKYLSVSEPFMSTLFLFISQNFSGFGLPDFSELLQQSITNNIATLKKEQ